MPPIVSKNPYKPLEDSAGAVNRHWRGAAPRLQPIGDGVRGKPATGVEQSV